MGIECARHEINFGKNGWLAVDVVGIGAGGGEGCLGLGVVLDVVVDFRLQQVQLHEQQLVIRFSHLDQDWVDDLNTR